MHEREYDSDIPANDDDYIAGAEEVRHHRQDVEQRMEVNHLWGESMSEDGEHTIVTLREQSSDPNTSTGKMYVYTKDVDGTTELFCKDEDGNVKQLTSTGWLTIDSKMVNTSTGHAMIGDLLIQWGEYSDTIAASSSVNVSFPVSFSDTNYQLSGTPKGTDYAYAFYWTTGQRHITISKASTDYFTLTNLYSMSSFAVNFYWMAIGN